MSDPQTDIPISPSMWPLNDSVVPPSVNPFGKRGPASSTYFAAHPILPPGELQHRYFYHCFPQWIAQTDAGAVTAILDSMFRWGLLLTPEEIVFRGETFRDAQPRTDIRVLQRRLCLTELAEHEVARHASIFGPIALEFDLTAIRRLGAMPVIYIPQELSPSPQSERFGLLGQTLVYRLFDAFQILSDLADLQTALASLPDRESVVLAYEKSGSDRLHSSDQLRHLLDGLTHGKQPFLELAAAVRALSSMFYPTDALSSFDGDGLLSYYREREWRIVSDIHFAGHSLDEELSREAKSAIVSTLSASLASYDAPLECHNFLDNCSAICRIDDKSVMQLVRRILAPEELLDSVINVASRYNYEGDIARLII